MIEINSCEVCGNKKLISVLNLGNHPLCDDLVPVGDDRVCKEYPIEILFCNVCFTAHQRKYNKAKASDTKQFIEERIIDTERELMAVEEDLKIFMDRNRRIENSPALQLEQQRLGREVTVLTGVFTTLKQQLETTKIEEVKESDYVIILDAPEVPLEKSKPNKRLMIILSGFLGLGLGLVLAFIREYAVNSEKEEKDKMMDAKSLVMKNISELIPGKSN